MQPLSPCVITSQLGFGGCGSPRFKPKSNKSSLSNFSPTITTHPKSSRIVQSILSSVLQLASNTNSTVEFTKREFMNSKIDQTNKKSLLSEMLKKNVDSKDINQALHGKPIMIKKPCDLTIETNVTTTKRELGSSTDTTTTTTTTTTSNEPNLTKKVLKFGNCPLVVREKSNLNNDSSKPDVSTTEPSKAVHKRINHHLSPVPITSEQDDDDDDDDDDDFNFECDMCDGSDSDDGYVEDDEEDEEDEDDDISEYDENNDEYDENNDEYDENNDEYDENINDVENGIREETVTQSNISSNDSNTLTATLPDGKAISTSTTVSSTVTATATTIVTTTTTATAIATATTSTSDSPTSYHSTTSHYSTAISILTPTNTTSTNTTSSICYYKSKSLPQPKRGILVNTKPVNLRTKGIPIPLSNTNFVLGSRSHHYGSRDKFNKRKHCHRHSHRNGEKNGDITLLDSEWKKDADDVLFWPMST